MISGQAEKSPEPEGSPSGGGRSASTQSGTGGRALAARSASQRMRVASLKAPLDSALRGEPAAKSHALQQRVDDSLRVRQAARFQAIADAGARPVTGDLPARLRARVEHLSGVSLAGAQVTYDSPYPARIGALACAQGRRIHLAPGQERHLPHEAWHIAQQAQGRVRPTAATRDGLPVNDEPALEREADRMGAIAMQGGAAPPRQAMDPVPPTSANTVAPIQGVFERVPRPSNDPSPQVWIDRETNELFQYVQSASDGSRIVLRSATRTVVVDRDGRPLESHLHPQDVHDEEVPGNPEKEEQEEEDMDLMPWHQGPPVVLDPAQREEGVVVDGGREGFVALAETMKLGKLVTNLSASMALRPLGTGQASLTHQEARYTAGQIQITAIALGDKDRPDTQFDDQESHTVSWTLLRNGLMALAGLSIADYLAFMEQAYEELTDFVQNPEGGVLQAIATGHGTLRQLREHGLLPADIWSKLCANFLVNYLQVYQLSTAATYRRGRALGHGEAKAMKRLLDDDGRVKNGQAPRTDSKLAVDIAKLLDVQFRVDSLGVAEYAYAVYHWHAMLVQTFPSLMAAAGDRIIKPVLGKQLAPSFKAELGLDPKAPATVADLLKLQELQLQKPNAQPRPSFEMEDPVAFEASVLNQLKTNFTASVGVRPVEQGQARKVRGLVQGQPVDIEQRVYGPAQLELSHLRISDMDRPKTRFIKDQKSHTVPWTLAREALLSFSRKPAPQLIVYLGQAFKDIAADMKNEEGASCAAQGSEILKRLGSELFTIEDFSLGLGQAIRLYFIAYQVADSTTYINPQEAERALGHGEAVNMQILRENEIALGDSLGKVILHPKERIIQAALGMFDAAVTAHFAAKNVLRAYANALHKLETAFPSVMKVFGEDIVKAFESRVVGPQGQKLGELK